MEERERWAQAVLVRLQRVTAARELSPVLEEAAVTEARGLTRALGNDQESLSATYLLGWLHWYRYQALPAGHDQQDLQAAMAMFTSCFISGMSGFPESLVPSLADQSISIATELLGLTQRSGDRNLLSATTDLWLRILTATPADHPDRAGRLSNLGAALLTRFERTGGTADLDAAITDFRDAVQATPADHPRRPAFLSNLGNALLTRFERTGAMADLDAAITDFRDAVQATPADDPRRAGRLSNLGNALRARFERTGAAADLDAAIEVGQQAVQATPADDPERAGYLSNLGNALQAQFGRTGLGADLDAAITNHRDAVEASPVGHPSRAGYLSSLGAALFTRFENMGEPADLDAAIAYFREVVQASPVGHPSRAGYLSNFGAALFTRFERTGAAVDLDAALEAGQQAVQATPADHPSLAGRLSNLQNVLRARFQRTGSSADLDAALEVGQQAVQAIPASHPDRAPVLSNLGIALQAQFERTGASADLDAAITNHRDAVQATPVGHPRRAIYLSNLGNTLRARFERTGASADVDAAITSHRDAVQAIPAGHPDRAGYLSNLGIALRDRFERTGASADLDAAITNHRDAVQAIPADHPSRAWYLSNLGIALRARFERTGASADLDAAFQSYTEAANVDAAAVSVRILAGRIAASLVVSTDPGRAASLLEAAVLLLPEVAPRFLERGDQQYAIGRFAGLAADAAALALSNPAVPEPQRPARALGLLEAARGVLLSQALSTRGDLSELRERHPELAARFVELRDWLDRPSPVGDGDPTGLPSDGSSDALQRTIRDRREADTEFTQLLARIRSLEGFAAFALPPSADKLKAQAEQGPIVVLNVSVHRSDAILLSSSGITSQSLPGLDQVTVIDQIKVFQEALHTITAAESPLAQVRAQEAIQQVLAWLWDNAAEPILHALGHREQPPAGKWPRLWWVPGGLLSLLPIHAAGHHTYPPDPGHRTVMDRVVSSYTPTIGALTHARIAHAVAAPSATIRSLIVAMPTTPNLPGQGRLPYVPAEAALLKARLPRPTLLTEPLTARPAVGQLPTKAAVLEHLPDCAIAHFACHSYTDPADPSQSRLLLHDHHRDPLTVATLAPLALDFAQLAYLSACGTARVTNTDLLDEAIHLTSAFQLVGFPHVIGTLWEINDAIAVEIADIFYRALTSPDGDLAPYRAAQALHEATRALRDRRPAVPYLWASHIHAGA
jgi:hypothetical protein